MLPHCPNCAAPTDNKFCANCGQSVRTFRLSLWRLIADFVGETFEVDGRLARTLSELFLRPGKLPQAFSENRRASFVSPVRMYLFSSLLFFFLLAFGGADNLWVVDSVDGLHIDYESRSTEQPQVASAEGSPSRASPELLLPYLDKRSRQRLMGLLAEPYREVNHDLVRMLSEGLEEFTTSGEEPEWWLRRILENVVALFDDLSGYMNAIVENLPLAMFVLLPFYALLLKLLFFSSRRYFAEHLVFATYLHVLAFLVFSVSILVPATETGPWAFVQPLVSAATFGYLGIYTFLAMRSYYGQGGSGSGGVGSGARLSNGSIGWRFVAMGVCYLLLLIPALLLVMAFSFIGL